MTRMTRKHVTMVVVVILASVAGCGDSWNSLNQMEKNVRNEVVDILSKVQDEASAKFAVTDAAERAKAKYEAVTKRAEKYIKSQFLTTLNDQVEKLQQAKPDITMDEIIAELKSRKEQAIKTEQINDLRTKLSLASYPDHYAEMRAISERMERELARIRLIPEEPASGTSPMPVGPKGGGGSYLRQALDIPNSVLGKKR
ncbi:MAG: hypothetical protein FJ271_03070 [Planctomycetes bacterium]|nr:hypothetical protein [Planctomycetota bacterium]